MRSFCWWTAFATVNYKPVSVFTWYNLLCWLLWQHRNEKIFWVSHNKDVKRGRAEIPAEWRWSNVWIFQTPVDQVALHQVFSCCDSDDAEILFWPKQPMKIGQCCWRKHEHPSNRGGNRHHRHWWLPEVSLFLFRSVWEKGTKPNREEWCWPLRGNQGLKKTDRFHTTAFKCSGFSPHI